MTTPQSAHLTGRLLIVDDRAANREHLARLLARDGYTVLTARSGDEALDLVAGEQPDAVLLDVMMPGLDGFEVCRALKEQSSTRFIPVILVTELHDAADRIPTSSSP